MATKEYTFDNEQLPTVGDITLTLSYSYSYDPGCTSGPMEACYPEEEESEINAPAGYEQVIMAAYIKAAHAAIKAVDAIIEEMSYDNNAIEWAEADARDWADDFADAEYDRMREAA